MVKTRVAVVGAGVTGVGAALALLQNVPGIEVTILAEQVTPNTTGDGAAGIWGPHLVKGDPQKIAVWSRCTHDLLENLWREGDCEGIGLCTGFDTMPPHVEPWEEVPFFCAPVAHPGANSSTISSKTGTENLKMLPTDIVYKDDGIEGPTGKSKDIKMSSYSDIFSEEEPSLSEEENSTASQTVLPGSSTERRCQIVTFYAEPRKLLHFLMIKLKALGGLIVIEKVASLQDLASDYDLVVNCSGLGAHDLVSDFTMQPIRGQVTRIQAPFIKNFKTRGSSYIVPNDDVIVLGGTAQRGDWRREPDEGDSARILEGCSHLVPSLRSTPLEGAKVWAGLRPFRPGGVRLELEECELHGKKVPVVHNYGHGGAGVTLFWGCALEVADIVKRRLGAVGSYSKL